MADTHESAQNLNATTVSEVDVNLDEIFGMPGAESIMLPDSEKKEEEKTKTVFTNTGNVDLSFIDKPEDGKTPTTPEQKLEVEETIAELDQLITQEEEAGTKGGRPKVDKSGLADLAAKMIEEGTLMPFDDDKPLEEYTAKDFRELFEANFQEREAKVRSSVPKEFFNALPEELQIAAKYVADGGQDLKGLFRTLAHVEEMIQLDPTNEYDQEEIVRQYLYATGFGDGNSEEIEDEITDWKDLGKLEAKANQFKPKLDRMQEEIVARQLAEQEARKEKQEKQAKVYMDNVYNTLVGGEIGGVKLDKKVQGMLYSGLVQPNYPSISGKPTNLLGHLLEKYQFVEPRHDLIAEALWLLADPDGYKGKIKEQGGKVATEKAVRQLKTEEQRKITSSTPQEEEYTQKKTQQKTISRNQGNIFRRF
jgi:hypothetical protein